MNTASGISKVPNFQPYRGDGRLACELDNRKFWQSRMTRDGNVAKLPVLTDLEKLARDVRAGGAA